MIIDSIAMLGSLRL